MTVDFTKSYSAWFQSNISIVIALISFPLAVIFYYNNGSELSFFADYKITSLISLTALASIWGGVALTSFISYPRKVILDIDTRMTETSENKTLTRSFNKIRITHNNNLNSKNFQLTFFNGSTYAGEVSRGYVCALSVTELANLLTNKIDFTLEEKFN